MALYGHNFDVFVGTFVDGSVHATADLLVDNEIGIQIMDAASKGALHDAGTSDTAIAAGTPFRIVKKNEDGSFRYSPVVNLDNVYSGEAIAESAASVSEAQQVVNIGYHGTGSDSIRLVNSNRYAIRLNFVNDGEVYSRQKDQYFFEKVSDADAKEIEIANSFAVNMSSMEYLADGSHIGAKRAKIKVERFSSASDVATGSVTGTFTQGSKIVSFSGTGHNVEVGNYIRIATGTASPVYKVVSLPTTSSVELDQPYQGSDVTTSSAAVKRITAANVEAASAGLKLTGLPSFHKVGLYPYSVVEFNVTLDGFGATEIETATKAAKGSNVGEAVADMEWFSLGRNTQGGASYHGTGFPSAQSYASLDAVDGTDYDLLTLNYTLQDDAQYHAIAPGGKIKGTIVVALPNAAANHDLAIAFSGLAGIATTDFD